MGLPFSLCSLNSLNQSLFFYLHFSVCNKSNFIPAAQQVFHTGLRFILPSAKFSMAAEVWTWAVQSSLRFPTSILPQFFQTSYFSKTGLPFASNQPSLVPCKGKAKNSPQNINLIVPLAQHPWWTNYLCWSLSRILKCTKQKVHKEEWGFKFCQWKVLIRKNLQIVLSSPTALPSLGDRQFSAQTCEERHAKDCFGAANWARKKKKKKK